MEKDPVRPLRAMLPLLAMGALACLLIFATESCQSGGRRLERYGGIELDVRSDYSKIRIRKQKNVRALLFVRDSGEEVVESLVDMDAPHELLIDYTRYMFISYAFRPKQEKALIVGLGGGAMVHFLKHYDPKVKVDAVEIDPIIVSLADRLFGVRSGGNIKIVTQDAFDFLKKTENRYDVIYMDAFLKPSRDTDATGAPLRLKTIRFYKEVQKKLTPEGMVVFNINDHPRIAEDYRNIRDAFPQTYSFALPYGTGLVVVGSMAEKRLSAADVRARAEELDRRFNTSFSFRHIAARLTK